MNGIDTFRTCFRALTDHRPFHWQCELFQRISHGKLPRACDLPTGAGKTSVIPIWLIALANSFAAASQLRVPRRLIYVVNRRTVVDQSTDVVTEICKRIAQANNPNLISLREQLSGMSCTADDSDNVIAVSTLRGELADNGQWRLDPTRPAIVIGTVDMIGSKLLFRGYGDGRYFRAHHAGIIGRDTMCVHDESHLSPTFESLLRSIAEMQKSRTERRDSMTILDDMRPLQVLNLTATSPTLGGETEVQQAKTADEVLRLKEREEHDELLTRLRASKRLRLRAEENAADVLKAIKQFIVDQASVACRILAYVQKPEDAHKIAKDLRSNERIDKDQVEILTGVMRGHERDSLAESDVVRWFAGGPALKKAAIIISTSAGEVGVDWDADHLVSDLSTLECMIQRFGRVNRRGGKNRVADLLVVGNRNSKDGVARLVEAAKKPNGRDGRLWETWKSLQLLPRFEDNADVGTEADSEHPPQNASPLELRALAGREEACAELPISPELTDVLIDAWTQTAFAHSLPNQPPVADWLHGRSAEPMLPETVVAWREEVPMLAAHANAYQIKRAMQFFPLRASERLRAATNMVVKHLKLIAQRKVKADEVSCGKFALLLRDAETAEWLSTEEILSAEKADLAKLRERLAFATLILPTTAGGLSGGMLDGGNPDVVDDVAELHSRGQLQRMRYLVDDETDGRPLLEHSSSPTKDDSALITAHRIQLGDEEYAEEDQPIATLEYRVARRNADFALGSPSSTSPEPLQTHVNAVVGHVNAITKKLELPKQISEALRLAAVNHDFGKNRELWQLAARNSDFANPIAKSGRAGFDGRALQGYRHEFGSVLEAARLNEIIDHAEADLILHLIASHHGWARPHFEQRAADSTFSSSVNEEAMIAVMQRYSRLQQRFGPWTLAWLESLLRCADGLASAGIVPCNQTSKVVAEADK